MRRVRVMSVSSSLAIDSKCQGSRRMKGAFQHHFHMTNNRFNARQTFSMPGGRTGTFYSLPRLEEEGLGAISRLPVSHPDRSRVAPAQLRRQEGPRRRRPGAGRLEAQRRADGRGSLRRGADRPSGLHGSAAARRPRGHALGRGAARQGPEGHRASRPGRPRRGPLGPGGRLVHARRPGTQHGDRVCEEPRPLRVSEVGHAGFRRLPRRAAWNRDRAPGQPRVPGARRHREAAASTTPTASSAPTRTRR